MRKRFFGVTLSPLPLALSLLCALLFGLCLPVEAEQAKKLARIGLVTQGPGTDPVSYRADALRQGLRELGWIEGNNITIEHRRTGGKSDHAPTLAAELVRLNVDVIVWSGGVQGAKQIKTIPVVYVGTSDLVSTGLVASLARPGGNITGLSSLSRELSGKRLELLKETFARVSKVAYLFNPAEPASAAELEQLRGPATALRLTLRPVEARGPDQIGPAFIREACTSTSAVRAVCGSSARTDLCGGRSAMAVPTATDRASI